jgi:hypothetical protein
MVDVDYTTPPRSSTFGVSNNEVNTSIKENRLIHRIGYRVFCIQGSAEKPASKQPWGRVQVVEQI